MLTEASADYSDSVSNTSAVAIPVAANTSIYLHISHDAN